MPSPELAAAAPAPAAPAPAPAALAPGTPIADALSAATSELAAAGCGSPRLDAELLLAEALGVSRARLVIDRSAALDAPARDAFAALLARRRAREPVAYILGRRGFRWIEPACDPRALIPRPETELLVEVALGLPRGARVLDVGTGSGAVALALASERPDLRVTGIERSAGALALARENGARLGLPVDFVIGEHRAGLVCDALLANLPYVPDGARLAPELGFEPAEALYAGSDGLDAIRALCRQLDGVAFVALEHGFDQGPAVAGLLRDAGFAAVETLRDLAGHERVTVGRR